MDAVEQVRVVTSIAIVDVTFTDTLTGHLFNTELDVQFNPGLGDSVAVGDLTAATPVTFYSSAPLPPSQVTVVC